MQNKIIHKVSLGSVFLATFLLPLSTTFSNIALAVLLAATLYSFFKSGIDASVFKTNKFYVLSPLAFYIPVLIGVLYSPMYYDTWKEVKRMAFMFALPLLILRKDFYSEKYLTWAAYGLILGTLISATLLLIINFYRFSGYPLTWNSLFSYNHTGFNFTASLNLHPIYLGSYYLMALVFSFTKIPLKVWQKIGISFILFTTIIFLNSRIILGLTTLFMLIFLIKHISWKSLIIGAIGGLILFLLLLPRLKNTYVYEKFVSGTQWELSHEVGTFNTDKKHTADSRMSRWKIAIELFAQHPLIGTGTGTEREELGEKFKAYNMTTSFENRYNAHNQYLGFSIRFGLFGLLVLLIYFGGNLYNALQLKNLTFLCFLLLIMGVFLVENFSDRNMGINFIAIFGTLFYLRLYKKDKPLGTA